MTRVNVGLVGGGLMGRELAAAIGRWAALEDHPVTPRLTAVCDTNDEALSWFGRIESVASTTTDYRDLLASDDLDVLYIAVPHHLHEQIYIDAAQAGKDFLGEKPFGIDLAAAERIMAAIEDSGVFVRCSSEVPFYPGAQAAVDYVRQGRTGRIIEATNSFLHSSDLDLDKPINWKRQAKYCGDLGVLGDLGIHTVHVPLRLDWRPRWVYGVLQDLVSRRRAIKGGDEWVACDTPENGTLVCTVESEDGPFMLTLELKRIAPGEKNTWLFRVLGMEGGVEFSTKHPRTLKIMDIVEDEQVWRHVDLGSQSSRTFPTITAGIFEVGFSDQILQMWAAFLAERAGELGDRFGCVTPQEAVDSHRIFAAGVQSAADHRAVELNWPPKRGTPVAGT